MHLFGPGIALLSRIATALVSPATLGLSARAEWLRIGVRVASSWIAAIRLMTIELA